MICRYIVFMGITAIVASCLLRETSADQDFRAEQLRYSRVRTAYREKDEYCKRLLAEHNINSTAIELYIRGFKRERELEVWVREKVGETSKYVLLKTYDFTGYSGNLGPKKKQGDLQIPEGFYSINRFNPQSRFYLSLGLDYPNRVDRKRAGSDDPGGDIFIHGNRVTIGCIPIGNDNIKEVYLLALEAKQHGQDCIPVHIFPCRFSPEPVEQQLMRESSGNNQLLTFWKTLKTGYDLFEKTHQPPSVTIDDNNSYVFHR